MIVWQTGRQLKIRIAEHRNHIRYKTSAHSVITEHRLLHDHDFQWNNVQILDEEPSYRKRLISEMLHIKKQKNNLNLQTDTEGLHKAYLPIINKVCTFDSVGPFPFLSQCVAFRLSERSRRERRRRVRLRCVQSCRRVTVYTCFTFACAADHIDLFKFAGECAILS